MQQTYRLLTAALAFAGCTSLVITGELNAVFVLPGLALFPGYYRYLKGRPAVNRWIIGGLSVVELFVMGFDAVVISADFLVALAHMTIVFQALKSFDLQEPWDPLQVYFMALLQLVITSELSLSILVGAVFVAFLLILMSAMVFSHFSKEGTLHQVDLKRPLIVITSLALAGTLLFFVSLPRLKSGIWGRKSADSVQSVGFSGEVDFGSFGEVLNNDAIVMRVELSGRYLPLYWRGTALDYFNGVSWKDSFDDLHRMYRRSGEFMIRRYRGEASVQKVIVEPMDTDVVFGLGRIVAVETPGRRLRVDEESGTVRLVEKSDRRFSYTAYSIPSSDLPVQRAEMYLQMPEGLDAIRALAEEVTVEATNSLEAASKIELHLKTGYEYSVETAQPPAGITAVEDFLFNTRKGFCEHYATAMVLMLRSIGIPSRIVTGYKGGEVNSLGDYVIVRQKNAHSWVEALIDGKWARFDPTPLSFPAPSSALARAFDALRMDWYRYVVGFSSFDQVRILRSLSLPVFRTPDIGGVEFSVRPVYLIGVLLAAVAAWVFISFFRRLGRRSYETRVYLGLRKKVFNKGGAVGPASTPREVLRAARRIYGYRGEEIMEFIRMYEEARFGGRPLGTEERKRFEELAGRH